MDYYIISEKKTGKVNNSYNIHNSYFINSLFAGSP